MEVLDPLVGSMAASTCVRATALSIGKTSDELVPADLPSLEQNIRRLLGPVAPAAIISQVITDIEERAR
jgi:hypothetical protein